MRGVPHAGLFARQRDVVVSDDRIVQAEPEILVHPAVHRSAADVVVVVIELRHREDRDAIRGAQHLPHCLHRAKAGLRHRLRPVVGRRHAHGPRRHERGDLDIAGTDPEVVGVLARASALHPRADHHHREEDGGPRVQRAKDECLRAAAARPADANPRRIDVRQAGEEVQRATRVPRLQPHDRLKPAVGLRVEEEPGCGRGSFGRLSTRARRRSICTLSA